MYYNAMNEDPYLALPVTFHCEHSVYESSYREFLSYYSKCEMEAKEANRVMKLLSTKIYKLR